MHYIFVVQQSLSLSYKFSIILFNKDYQTIKAKKFLENISDDLSVGLNLNYLAITQTIFLVPTWDDTLLCDKQSSGFLWRVDGCMAKILLIFSWIWD